MVAQLVPDAKPSQERSYVAKELGIELYGIVLNSWSHIDTRIRVRMCTQTVGMVVNHREKCGSIRD